MRKNRKRKEHAFDIKHVLEQISQGFPFTTIEFFELVIMAVLLVVSICGTTIALALILEAAKH